MAEISPPAPDPSPTPCVERIARVCLVILIVWLLFVCFVSTLGGFKVLKMRPAATARKMCVECAGAITSFYSDYNHLPLPLLSNSADWAGTLDEPGLLSCLSGDSNNPRKLNYIDGLRTAQLVDGQYINGIHFGDDPDHTTLTDPWGHPYRILMDTDDDGAILNPATSALPNVHLPKQIRGKRAIIWSAGPDGDFNTWADNPQSW